MIYILGSGNFSNFLIKKLNKKKPAIVLGAGGAAESVVYSLYLSGFKNIYITNRTKYKAQMMGVIGQIFLSIITMVYLHGEQIV